MFGVYLHRLLLRVYCPLDWVANPIQHKQIRERYHYIYDIVYAIYHGLAFVRPSDRQFKRRVKHIGKHKGANVGEKLENFPMGPRNLVEFVFREELVIVGEQPLIVTF